MKILFVHNFHQNFGGDDAIVQNYVELLHRRGHRLELYQRHNDEINSFGLWQKIRFISDVIFSIRTWWSLRRMVRSFGPDLIFVHGVFSLISPSVYVGMYDPLGHFVYFKSHGGFSYESGRKRNTAQATSSRARG